MLWEATMGFGGRGGVYKSSQYRTECRGYGLTDTGLGREHCGNVHKAKQLSLKDHKS